MSLLTQFGHERPYWLCSDVKQVVCAFSKGVAGYAEEEGQRRCRQTDEISR